MEVPAAWNGNLVMWAHGFRGTGLELTVDNHPLRVFLLAGGYAWAASSFSRNDYDIEAGAVDTRKLVRVFKKQVDKPDLVYLTGASMGGHVTGASIEKWKKEYDGALAICGVMGDFENFDFFLDFNLAGQQIALGSSIFPVDPFYPFTTAQDIKAALELFPGGWPSFLNEDGADFKQLVELRSGGDRPNFDEAWFYWNSFPEAGSGIPGNLLFDLGVGDGTIVGRKGVVMENKDVTYQVDLDPAISFFEQDLNDNIFRVKADKKARKIRGIKNVRAIEGKFNIPVLTLHNLGDLFVPFHNEVEYYNDAAAKGNDDLLVQRAIRGVGHCDFTGSELVTAMSDLIGWVEFGIKPAGDIVGDPAEVADPDYGCTFTDDPFNEHLLATPCP
jgi:fermentation-respiration switch protein FrsA (DUF1100 family)